MNSLSEALDVFTLGEAISLAIAIAVALALIWLPRTPRYKLYWAIVFGTSIVLVLAPLRLFFVGIFPVWSLLVFAVGGAGLLMCVMLWRKLI